jgi:hypothetical protein
VTVSARLVRYTVAVLVVAAAVTYFVTREGEKDPDSLRPGVLRHEKLIAQCMHRHGFEYTVSVPPDVVIEEARRKGRPIADIPTNPNDAIVGALSPARQQAWGDALFGTETSNGCYYGTYRAAWGVDLGDAAADAEKHQARVKADRAVRSAEQEYVRCMSRRGYQVTTTEDIHAVVGREVERLGDSGAEAFVRAANTAHETCVRPYRTVFDQAYLRHSARS